MSQSKLHPEYLRQKALQDAYIARKNKKAISITASTTAGKTRCSPGNPSR